MADPDDLDALEALLAAGTERPWRTGTGDHWSREVRAGSDAPAFCGARNGVADAALIVAAVNTLPTHIAEIRRLRAALARYGAHRGDDMGTSHDATLPLCETVRWARRLGPYRLVPGPKPACSCGLKHSPQRPSRGQWIVFLAKDNALLATLRAYLAECVRLGAAPEQIAAVLELSRRVEEWRAANPEKLKVPDVAPGELR